MCGLVALVSKKTNGFTVQQQDMFSTLLYLDALRGLDSTGVFSILNNGDLHMVKEIGSPLKMFGLQEFKDIKSEAFQKGSAMVGHNRKATKGSVNDVNAHPFIVDDKICLVHNGTLFGHRQHANVEVDSHAIAHLLAKDDDVAAVASKLDGAYALIWHNFEQNSLNFLRNTERPLFWAETENEWLWCSEKEMIDFVVARYNAKVTQGPFEQPEEVLTTYTLKDRAWELEATKLKITKPKPQQQSYNYDACAYGNDWEEEDPVGWQFRRNNWKNGTTHHTPPLQSKAYDKDPTRQALLTYGQGNTAITEKEFQLGIKNTSLVCVDDLTALFADYTFGTEVTAEAFDYTYVNELNGEAGYFVWFSPVADPNLVLRHRYEPNTISEHELINMVTQHPFYQLKMGNRCWHKAHNVMQKGKPVGWVLIDATSVTPCYNKETSESVH